MHLSVPVIFAVIAGFLALWMALRPEISQSSAGKMVAFVALFILPVAATWAAFSGHMEQATSTSFCLSCHVMTGFGQSLRVDDPSYLAARHFQNHLVPPDRACYTCHTDYTLFGTVNAKRRGLKHLWVQYIGTIPKPEDIKLYTPYNNRECLHCHLGARRFEEGSAHQKRPELLTDVKSGKLSCLSSGCHDIVHDVGTVKDTPVWKGAK